MHAERGLVLGARERQHEHDRRDRNQERRAESARSACGHPPRARVGRPQRRRDSRRSRHEVTRTRTMWEALECAPGPRTRPAIAVPRSRRASRAVPVRLAGAGGATWHSPRVHLALSERASRGQRRAPAGRRRRTGSPCETRMRSTGSSSSGRSIARRSSCVPAPSQRSGHRRRTSAVALGFAPAPEQHVADDERSRAPGASRRPPRRAASAAPGCRPAARRPARNAIGHRDLPVAQRPRRAPRRPDLRAPRARRRPARASTRSRAHGRAARARPAARSDR